MASPNHTPTKSYFGQASETGEAHIEDKLSRTQRDELRKAFAVCDADGDGLITASEVGRVMQVLSQSSASRLPTEAELAALMAILDVDGDGVIQEDEFMNQMADWLADDQSVASAEAVTTEEQRHRLHRRVSEFFLQFSVDAHISTLRGNLQTWMQGQMWTMYQQQPTTLSAFSESQIAQIISSIQDTNVASLATLLTSDEEVDIVRGLGELHALLEITIALPTPASRRPHGDLLIAFFSALHPLIPTLASLLLTGVPEVEWRTLEVLSRLLPGPNVASTPDDHWLHHARTAFKTSLVEANGHHAIVSLANSQYRMIVLASLACMRSLARDHSAFRDALLSAGALGPVTQLCRGLLNPVNLQVLRHMTRTIALLCGETHDRPADINVTRELLPAVFELLFHFGSLYEDVETLANVCSALVFLLPGHMDADGRVSRAIVQLLVHREPTVVRCGLFAIAGLLVDDALTQSFLMHGLLPAIRLILVCDQPALRYKACTICAILSGVKGRFRSVLDADVVPHLIRLTLNDPPTHAAALYAVRCLARGGIRECKILVNEYNLVDVVTQTFAFFESQDSVLHNVYNYNGPTFDFAMLSDAVKCINEIVDTGDISVDHNHHKNPFIPAFTPSVIDRIDALMTTMRTAPEALLSAFRAHYDSFGASIDDSIRLLLVKLRDCFDARLKHGDMSSDTLSGKEACHALLIRCFDEGSQSAGRVLLRLNLSSPLASSSPALALGGPESSRIMEVPRTVSLSQLSTELKYQLGLAVSIAVLLPTNELMAITTDQALQTLFNTRLQEGAKYVALTIVPITMSNPGSSMSSVSLLQLKTNAGMQHASDVNKFQFFSDLVQHTHFGLQEINELLSHWSQWANDNGELDMEGFRKGLASVGITDIVIVQENWSAFDLDKSGSVSFAEFIIGLSALTRGDTTERLALMFRAYDMDGDGSISRDELIRIVAAARQARNQPVSLVEINRDVDTLFAAVDSDGDGRISQAEFVAAAKSNKLGLLGVHA